MTPAEKHYTETGLSIKGAEQSQMFGKPCFKVNGKAFCSLFDEEMVFKLEGKSHKQALALKGARQFDPSGKNRPMKEWVQVPYMNKSIWPELAKAAMKYVKSISSNDGSISIKGVAQKTNLSYTATPRSQNLQQKPRKAQRPVR